MLWFAAAALAACAPAIQPLAVGMPLPALHFVPLDGGIATTRSYAGRALVLNIWATWCAPCRAEMPSLQRLAQAFDDADLAVVAVSVDDDLNLVREFVLRYGIRFLVASDALEPAVRDQLGISVYPTTILVARDGRVAAVVSGERDWATEASLRQIESALDVKRIAGGAGGK